MTSILILGGSEGVPPRARTALDRRSIRVVSVASVDAALEPARTASLVLLDVHHLGEKTRDAVAALRGSAPILLVATPPMQERLRDAGADGFVARPLTAARLLAALRALAGLGERGEERASIVLAVDWTSEGREGTGSTRDLTGDGMFVATADPPEEGATVEVVFSLPLPEAKPIRAGAVVARRAGPDEHHGTGMGLRFTSISAGDRGAIARYVRGRGVA